MTRTAVANVLFPSTSLTSERIRLTRPVFRLHAPEEVIHARRPFAIVDPVMVRDHHRSPVRLEINASFILWLQNPRCGTVTEFTLAQPLNSSDFSRNLVSLVLPPYHLIHYAEQRKQQSACDDIDLSVFSH
ncbi:hypothetical protein PsorP6_012281 [Peronosclerospora sorghi]|uniref:Uncharacterized protein n=1 Tax=Peronosclerospora sorghi TaxID=230839 RepID=A0ACC0WJ88_9STRA|nr:hypothetical protein PsorP6_012281 [Peronosclerospora sorghi]